MQEMPEPQPSKCEGERNQECILQQRIETVSIGNRTMKMETDVFNPSHTAELQFLRSRVRELEKEKAEMAAENQWLQNMLVKEIPDLLSTMWQNLGQANHPPYPAVSPQAVSTAIVRGESYTYTHHSVSGHSGRGFSPPLHHQPMSNRSAMTQDDVNGSMSNFGAEMAISEHSVDGDLELSDITEDDDPHSSLFGSAADLPGMRTCSETHCVSGTGHVNQVEVYPSSGVFCEMRSWHAANQTQSPTAMARTLLLGVFDMDTLLNSNLRGGRSRRPTFPNHRTALDPHKLNAIYNATLARFPLARKGQIGTGINSKLSEIRFRSRRANRDPSYL
ncbi:uncharacterized protein LOC120017908 isoform X1 [Salvelinus namaycush]|uniref:Uncharacterized protein LOC120017908 isoform X1 n=1 Tax=Salvelinus namaycush TaxID=8040 RepID=A0A8U0P1A4_SALNM|nr:uncharacterized protein LOC120017908 isoform X1 [Salvelinus namaycush]